MIRSLRDLDLSKLTKRLPCGDVTFQRKLALEYLLISDYEYKKHKHDQRNFCEEIVYECLLTWKKNLEENGEVATNQKLITILDNVRKEGLIKKEDFRFLEEPPDACFHDKVKRFKRWFKKFLQILRWLIFAAVFIFVLGYYDLVSLDVCACFLSTCFLAKLIFFRKDLEVPKKFTFQISKRPLGYDIKKRLDQFKKLKKINKKEADKSIPHIKFKCVMKKRENDILLEIYELNDMLRMFDVREFLHQDEIRNTLEAAFNGGGILLLSGPFVTKSSEEKVTIAVEFHMSPWDSKVESMIFWASEYFMTYTSRIKFRNDQGEFEVKLDGITTAKDGIIPNELSNKNAKIDEVSPITLRSLMHMTYYKKQPSYEFLESLCLKALSRGDPLAMQRITRDALISPERKPDQNNGRNFAGGKKNAKTTFHSSRKSIPVTPVHELSGPAIPVHELSSPATHGHELSSPARHFHEILSSPERHVHELSSPATHSHELLLSTSTPVLELSRPTIHVSEFSHAAQFSMCSSAATDFCELSNPMQLPMCYSAVNYSVHELSSLARHFHEILSSPERHIYELSSPATHSHELLLSTSTPVLELSRPTTPVSEFSHAAQFSMFSSAATDFCELSNPMQLPMCYSAVNYSVHELSSPARHFHEILSSPERHVHELSSPATHSHELLLSTSTPVLELSRPTIPGSEFSHAAQFSMCSSAATDFCELSNPMQLPMCYSAVNYSVSCLMSMGPGYFGLN